MFLSGVTEWTLPPPSEELLWKGRGVFPPVAYEVTSLRAIARSAFGRRIVRELPLATLSFVTVVRSHWWYYPFGLSDLTIRCGDETLTFHAIRRASVAVKALRGAEVARGLELAAAYRGDESDIFVVGGPGEIRSVPEAQHARFGVRPFVPALGMLLAYVGLFAYAAIHRREVNYPARDAIYPNGVKKSEKEIVRFMENEVLPWARQTLGPVVGGAENVRCETCHGENPDARDWKMPAVAALPDPGVLESVSERVRESDALVHTAVYGYLATEENQKKMRWMREVVLPGMAKVLRRPPYDFTQSYEYNRQRFALGCYHCHQLDSSQATRQARR